MSDDVGCSGDVAGSSDVVGSSDERRRRLAHELPCRLFAQSSDEQRSSFGERSSTHDEQRSRFRPSPLPFVHWPYKTSAGQLKEVSLSRTSNKRFPNIRQVPPASGRAMQSHI